jgi:deazaflavin-dependent oxidoreductase (nitroreductase family)
MSLWRADDGDTNRETLDSGAGAHGHGRHSLHVARQQVALPAHRGWLGGKFFARAVMFLTTTGSQVGRATHRAAALPREGDTLVTVASKGGMSHHPLWYRNLAANPPSRSSFRGRKRAMTAHTATPDEKRAWWPKLCAMYPDYADYQARTERDIPVVVLRPRAS